MSTSKSNIEKGTASSRERSYVGQQKRQYLIASRSAVSNLGLMSAGPQNVANQLKSFGTDFDVVKVLHGRSAAADLSSLALGVARGPEILVARNFQVASGRFINADDIQISAQVCELAPIGTCVLGTPAACRRAMDRTVCPVTPCARRHCSTTQRFASWTARSAVRVGAGSSVDGPMASAAAAAAVVSPSE